MKIKVTVDGLDETIKLLDEASSLIERLREITVTLSLYSKSSPDLSLPELEEVHLNAETISEAVLKAN